MDLGVRPDAGLPAVGAGSASDLPADVLGKVVDQLEPRDAARASCTARAWRDVVRRVPLDASVGEELRRWVQAEVATAQIDRKVRPAIMGMAAYAGVVIGFALASAWLPQVAPDFYRDHAGKMFSGMYAVLLAIGVGVERLSVWLQRRRVARESPATAAQVMLRQFAKTPTVGLLQRDVVRTHRLRLERDMLAGLAGNRRLTMPLLRSYLAAGVDLRCTDGQGRRPLEVAMRHFHVESVTTLLDHGAPVNLAEMQVALPHPDLLRPVAAAATQEVKDAMLARMRPADFTWGVRQARGAVAVWVEIWGARAAHLFNTVPEGQDYSACQVAERTERPALLALFLEHGGEL